MLILLTLLACEYQAPVAANEAMLNGISGVVTYGGQSIDGPVHVLVYDVDNPPIPEGTGAPLTFASIDPADFTGENGVWSAPYGVTGIPDGEYYVRVLVDNDWDFSPLATAATAASCGDEAGGYITDIGATQLGTVELTGGEHAKNITLTVNRDYPRERAAFEISHPDDGQYTITAGGGQSIMTLKSVGIYSDLLVGDGTPFTLEGPYDGGDDLCQTGFVINAIDDDGDGFADPHPNPVIAEFGYADVWPRVYMRYNGPQPGNEEGLEPWPDGTYYATELPLLISFLGVDQDEIAASGEEVVLTEILAGWADLALLYEDGQPAGYVYPDEADFPKDVQWDVTVAPYSGQVWTVPNEMADYGSLSDDFDPAPQAIGVPVLSAEPGDG